MVRRASVSGWRTTALAVALFAITLNFLQPVVHAALMRDGAPNALWTVFCHAAAADPDGKPGSPPARAVQDHECCLGLAHAQALIDPSQDCLPVVFAESLVPQLPLAEHPTAVGIRDAPHRPRGPPSLA
jgi:Protein of unknown function (DUF2946)